MPKPAFRDIGPLDVDDSAIDAINQQMGLPVMVRAGDASSRRAVTPSRQTDKASAVQGASPQQKLTIRIPVTLNARLKRDALDHSTTVRTIVLRALRQAGYEVRDADLEPGAGGNC